MNKKFQCIICSRSFAIPAKLLEHVRTHTRERPFNCRLCPKTYKTKGALTIHLHEHTGKHHKCDQCSASFAIAERLKTHLTQVHNVDNQPKEECPTCGKMFTKGAKMKGHQLRVHTQTERPFECHICGKQLKTSPSLEEHLRTHTGEKPFPCPNCPAKFATKSQRTVHLARKHGVGVRLKCPVCNKNTGGKHELEMHMRTHTNERPFSCTICLKTFAVASSLKVHARVHAPEKPYSCRICGKAYSSPDAYKAHCQLHNGEVRSYPCGECQLSFYTNAKLKVHIAAVHRQLRPFACNVCGKFFTTKGNRNRHINSHLQETPYKCEICGKRFGYSNSFKLHQINMHSNSKTAGETFPCSKCSLILSSELELLRHYLRVHVGSTEDVLKCLFCEYRGCTVTKLEFHLTKHTRERPYSCTMCPLEFGRSDNLKTHLKKQHTNSTKMKYKCSKCSFVLPTPFQLLRHYLSDHVGSEDDVLKCFFCKKRYKTLRKLEFHYATHTQERPYSCIICPLSFSCPGNLTGHLKTHKKIN